jgi:cohesin loading factor subunit SCC2
LLLDEDADVPSEALIPKYQLQDLYSEAAKLKVLGATQSIPCERLVRLLNILEKNIRDGAKVSPLADPVSPKLQLHLETIFNSCRTG